MSDELLKPFKSFTFDFFLCVFVFFHSVSIYKLFVCQHNLFEEWVSGYSFFMLDLWTHKDLKNEFKINKKFKQVNLDDILKNSILYG